MTVRVQKRGVVAIPVELREKYDIQEGDIFSILDLGGVFVLSPGTSEVEKLSRRFRKLMVEKGVTIQEILDGLKDERERYYLEHYSREQSE